MTCKAPCANAAVAGRYKFAWFGTDSNPIRQQVTEAANDLRRKDWQKDWQYIRELSYYGSLGLQVALSIFIGYGIGRYLDGKFNTEPWLTVIFFILGVAAAGRNIGLAIKKIRKF